MQLTKHWAATLDDYAIDLAWSPAAADRPEESLLAAASASGPVSVLALVDGAKRHELPGHEGGTNVLAWAPAHQNSDVENTNPGHAAPNPDGGPVPAGLLLATGGQDGAVKFWDASAGQHVATAAVGTGGAWVEHLAWRMPPMPEATAGTLSTSDAPVGTKTAAPASGARRRPARQLFATAGKNLFALNPDASLAHAFKPAPKTISALAAQPDAGAIAAAYFGGVVLWDADAYVAQKELPYANGIHALVWSPDGKWLVSGNQDPSVHLWIPEQDIELHMSGYETKVKFLSFDHTSRWLATSGGRDACIWDCAGAGPEGREPAMLPHTAPLCAVSFQNAHGLLATGAQDGTVQLWSPERRQPLRATVKMPAAATKLAWSPDDRFLAIGSEKGMVYVLQCEA